MDTPIIGTRKAVSNIFRQFRTFIDPEKKLYKIEEGLFGLFRWGNFQPLPKIDYVLVFRSLFAKCEACSFDPDEDNPNAYYQVSLVHHSNRRIFVHETRKKNEAFEMAKRLSGALNTRLRDSATDPRHGVWVRDPATLK